MEIQAQDMPREAGEIRIPTLTSFMSFTHEAPPAYTVFNSFEEIYGLSEGDRHPAGFVVPPPPPPLGTRAIPISNPPREAVNSPHDSHYSSEGVSSPQYEVSFAPGTSYGSTGRRPLPKPPGRGSSDAVPTISTEIRINPPNEFGASRGADPYQPRFPSPTSGPPPQFVSSPARIHPALPTERTIPEASPPTPSTSSSGSGRHRPHRESLQSLTSSISVRSPASFNTMDPPPWAVTHPDDGITRDNTIVPVNQFIPVDINRDPGRMVSSNLGGFDLCMHKGDSQNIPSYGRGEQVEGYIDLKLFDHIAEIEVTMQGTLQVVYSERGMAYDEVNVTLFTETKTLFTSAWSRAPGQSHPFSFTFPDKCVASNTALPPTWSLVRPGVSAEVSYTIRAVLKRKGFLRKDEKVSTKVEYYPRTAPPLPEPVSPSGRKKPKYRVLEMEQNLRPTGQSAVNKPMVPTTFTARISLHLPLIYASGSTIPYTVSLSSPVGTSVPASLDVEVSIIKTAKVVVKKKPYEKKDVVAKGNNLDKQFELGHRRANTNNHEGSTVTIRGLIVAGSEGHEMSWGVEGVASITYVMRFVVTPTQQASEFTNFKDTLPTFEHSEEIVLTTDETATLLIETEARLPANGLGHGRNRSNTAATGLTHLSSRDSSNSGELVSNTFSSPIRETGRDSLHNARRVTSRPHTSSGPVF